MTEDLKRLFKKGKVVGYMRITFWGGNNLKLTYCDSLKKSDGHWTPNAALFPYDSFEQGVKIDGDWVFGELSAEGIPEWGLYKFAESEIPNEEVSDV